MVFDTQEQTKLKIMGPNCTNKPLKPSWKWELIWLKHCEFVAALDWLRSTHSAAYWHRNIRAAVNYSTHTQSLRWMAALLPLSPNTWPSYEINDLSTIAVPKSEILTEPEGSEEHQQHQDGCSSLALYTHAEVQLWVSHTRAVPSVSLLFFNSPVSHMSPFPLALTVTTITHRPVVFDPPPWGFRSFILLPKISYENCC